MRKYTVPMVRGFLEAIEFEKKQELKRNALAARLANLKDSKFNRFLKEK